MRYRLVVISLSISISQSGFANQDIVPRQTKDPVSVAEKEGPKLRRCHLVLTSSLKAPSNTGLTEKERLKYRIRINHGKLYWQDNTLVDNVDSPSLYSTIVIMDKFGHIYAENPSHPFDPMSPINDSVFLAGDPAAFAGRFLVKAGKIDELVLASHFYDMADVMALQFIGELESQGVSTHEIKIRDLNGPIALSNLIEKGKFFGPFEIDKYVRTENIYRTLNVEALPGMSSQMYRNHHLKIEMGMMMDLGKTDEEILDLIMNDQLDAEVGRALNEGKIHL